jgi:hypothetical protein
MIESGVVKYSALVTEINLKGPMKGWEIARLVRQIDPAFPIIYMTGAAADDWASEGAPNSILLKKPFAPRNWLRRCPSFSTQARRPNDIQSGARSEDGVGTPIALAPVLLLLALFGPERTGWRCQFTGAKQTSPLRAPTSENGPN